jgi:hypothetical protein
MLTCQTALLLGDNYFGALKKRQKDIKNPKTHYEKKSFKKIFQYF